MQSSDRDAPTGQVQYLGKRATLSSPRTYWSALDWFLAGPAAVLFYVLPMFHAQLSHLFTDSLEYQVAAKPVLPDRRLEELVIA